MDALTPLRERLGLIAAAAGGTDALELVGLVLPSAGADLFTVVWTDRMHHSTLEGEFAAADLPAALTHWPPAPARLGAVQLDPDRVFDRRLLARHAGGLVTVPVEGDDRRVLVWFAFGGTARPSAEQERAASALVALAGIPASAGDGASTELERLRRLEVLDQLLLALTGVLDVREVLVRISEIARAVVPHDSLGLPTLSEDRGHFIPYALTGTIMPEFPPLIPVDDPAILTEPWEFTIVDDIGRKPRKNLEPLLKMGYRGQLRLPIRLEGKLVALLDFWSFAPGTYTTDDVLVARRIADHVALALSHQRLAEEVRRAAEARERAEALETRVQRLSEEIESLGGRRIVGRSPAWRTVLTRATQVAATDTTVLLLGESGTGKEVVARLIHRASSRGGGPFVALNCAALPDQLLESELFGFERGAFTGATQSKPGQIERATGGVLFLDEVAEMSPSAQAKCLRVLQEREFQRLGGTRVLKADVRVIAATNRDLRRAIERGDFREDLYYRLQVFEIRLPPLRERRDDVLPLSEAFLEDIGRSFGRPPARLSPEACHALVRYPWPGNIRELRNTLERAAILSDGGLIAPEHLGLGPPGEDPAHVERERQTATHGEPSDLRSVERAMIEKALRDTRYNKAKAARLLGLTRTQLYVRLRKHGLE